MAFTNAEKTAIRQYLGFSELYRQIDPRVESQLDALPANNPDAETRVRNVLGSLALIDAKLMSAALTRLDASRVENIELLGPEQLAELRRQGRMLVNQIAVTFDITPPRDYFDPSGASGTGGLIALG